MVGIEELVRTLSYDGKTDFAEEYIPRLVGYVSFGAVRLNGSSYDKDHFEPVSQRSSLAMVHPYDKLRNRIAGRIHDLIEDNPEFKVYNPFKPRPVLPSNVIIANDLFKKAGDLGKEVCFALFLLTRTGEPYPDYVSNLYDFRNIKSLKIKKIQIGACNVKIPDVSGNTDSREKIDEEGLLEKYESLKGRSIEEFTSFYKQTRIFSQAYMSGKIQVVDVNWFKKMLKKVVSDFNSMQSNRFDKNLNIFLPIVEPRMLFHPLEEFYNVDVVRPALKQIYIESIAICRNQTGSENYKKMLEKSLKLRAPKGQILLAEEVLDDIKNGRIAILRSR